MDVQNSMRLSGLAKPQTAMPAAQVTPGDTSRPQGGAGATGATNSTATPTLPPATLAQAADTLQKQVSQQAPSVALSAGLDPDGEHPGQLLVELKDKATQQVFVRYYVPSEQVVKAAAQSPDQPMAPGSLLQEKA